MLVGDICSFYSKLLSVVPDILNFFVSTYFVGGNLGVRNYSSCRPSRVGFFGGDGDVSVLRHLELIRPLPHFRARRKKKGRENKKEDNLLKCVFAP